MIAPVGIAGSEPRTRRRSRLRPRERQLCWGLIDASVLALAASAWLATGQGGVPGFTLLCGLVAGLAFAGLYDARRNWSRWLLGFAAVKGLVMVIAWLTVASWLGAAELAAGLGWVLVAWGGMMAWRAAFFDRFAAVAVRHVVIVGVSEASLLLGRELAGHPMFRLLGYIVESTATAAPGDGPAVIGTDADLPRLAETLEVDTVLVPSMDQPCTPALVACIERGVSVMTFTTLYEQLQSRVLVSLIDLSWFVYELSDNHRPLYAMGKRGLDVAVALVGLAATALLLPALVMAIKLAGGPGPILYSQTRLGYRGRAFRIYKFRTMRQDAERHGAVWAAARDNRVTPVGALLRQTRLDELPQFWNVLKGEMSIVGPRPERPEFTSELDQAIPHYSRRLMVPPGVTGWAQVMFPYGASVDDAREKLQYDLFYVKHRSFYLDLKIMWKTVGVMAKKVGAR